MEGQGSEGNVGEGTKQDISKQETPSGYPPPSDYRPGYSKAPPTQYHASGSPALGALIDRFRRTDKLLQLIVFGIFLIFLGAIFMGIVSTSGGPNDWDEKYDDNGDGYIDDYEDYIEDRRFYDAARDITVLLGKIISNIGVLILAIALFGGGIANDGLDRYVRIGLIVAAGLIIGWSGMFT